MKCLALASVAQLVGCHPVHGKAAGLIPSQSMHMPGFAG